MIKIHHHGHQLLLDREATLDFTPRTGMRVRFNPEARDAYARAYSGAVYARIAYESHGTIIDIVSSLKERTGVSLVEVDWDKPEGDYMIPPKLVYVVELEPVNLDDYD